MVRLQMNGLLLNAVKQVRSIQRRNISTIREEDSVEDSRIYEGPLEEDGENQFEEEKKIIYQD